jgi:rfaE bifunctional protein nucleotidyltransferase chain/domain
MKLEKKVRLLQDLDEQLAFLPRPLVMTNGVFDILHRGHVSYLQQASELGASLLVAVNSDSSARMLGKGPDRPLNSADDRAYVLSGLNSVDLLIFFDELTPIELIKAIRPDIYVKGGDYEIDTMEETKVVRSWGGQSIAIPFVNGFSTTALVDRIRLTKGSVLKAAFLDRDCVMDKDKNSIVRSADCDFLPGAIDGMKKLQDAGFALVILSRQSGLSHEYYTEVQRQFSNKNIKQQLISHGVSLDGLCYLQDCCEGGVFTIEEDNDCSKLKAGLLLQAAHDMGISLSNSVLIGEKCSYIEAAHTAGVGFAYFLESDNSVTLKKTYSSAGYFSNLLDCVNQLLITIYRQSV